jgi:hypothetical protein
LVLDLPGGAPNAARAPVRDVASFQATLPSPLATPVPPAQLAPVLRARVGQATREEAPAVAPRITASPPPHVRELPSLDHVVTGTGGSNSLFGDDSELPASRTLSPESNFSDTGLGDLVPITNWPATEPHVDETGDFLLERAREILLRAVRNEAPVAGSLTMFRLRRARNRAELEALLDEVAARIDKPPHSLAAVQTLRRVRNVLDGRDTSPAPL